MAKSIIYLFELISETWLVILNIPAFAAAAAARSLQSCPTLCDPIDGSPPGSPISGILQAKNTGVGCHFLLQCRKVKSESEAAQLHPTPSDPMDCSPPGSCVHGICQARVLEWSAIAFSEKGWEVWEDCRGMGLRKDNRAMSSSSRLSQSQQHIPP